MYLDCIIFIDTIFKYVIMYTNINTVRNGGKRMKKLLLISFTILILLLTNVSANELDSSCKSVDYELMEKTEHFLNQFEDDHYFTDHDVDSSMNRQFACHVVYGALKTPWNLEPHKRVEDLNPFTCN